MFLRFKCWNDELLFLMFLRCAFIFFVFNLLVALLAVRKTERWGINIVHKYKCDLKDKGNAQLFCYNSDNDSSISGNLFQNTHLFKVLSRVL